MVTANDKQFYERMLSHRSLFCLTYDPKGKYLPMDETRFPMGKRYWFLDFDEIGYNFRMTDAQAAVGLVQLSKLDGFNNRRAQVASAYTQRLTSVRGLTLPFAASFARHVYHVYCVLIEKDFRLTKEDFMWEMYAAKRIKAWSHYMPIHLTSVYRGMGHGEGECPVAEDLFGKYISLPIHPRLNSEAIEYVTESIRELA